LLGDLTSRRRWRTTCTVLFRRWDNLAAQGDVLRQLDRLRVEIEELRASRKRLVLAADADRRGIERDLHDGVHQHFVALAVNLQLLGQAVDSDPATVRRLVEELGRDVQRGLEETVLLAQRIHPARLDPGGLAALLRSAAEDADVPASVEVTAGRECPPEVEMTVYLFWLAILAHASSDARPSISVRAAEAALEFDIVGDVAGSDVGMEGLRSRAEALGGRLTIRLARDGRTRASCSLPLS
jgi:signal transduction histidine kinase